MRLTEFRHTTSFRQGVLFLALFGLGSALLFAFVYWQTVDFMRSEQDDWLARESAGILNMTPAERLRQLSEKAHADPRGMHLFSEFDAQGDYVAGDLKELPAKLRHDLGPAEFFLRRNGHRSRYRGRVTQLADGHLLVVMQNVHEPREFQERLVNAMLTAGGLTLLLGLLGAGVLGTSTVRHIDAITGSIRRIVTGDLSQRLPIRRGADDINRLADAVNGMLDDIERLMHEVKGVCDGIAHDLRTPLTRVLGGLERAQRRAREPEEFRQAIAQAVSEIDGLLRTFSAMLRISEIEAGARKAGFVPVELATLLADVVEFYQPLAEERGLQLSLAAEADVATWRREGDPSLLFDALSNLLDNALKFTPGGGRVVLSARQEGELHVIAVSDSGPGIPAAERASAMTRFYRGEPSRHTSGNGLGLALVAVIARLHEMHVELASSGMLGGLEVRLSWAAEGRG